MHSNIRVLKVNGDAIYPPLYNKLSYSQILIGSYDLLEDRRLNDIIVKNFFSVYFNSLLYETN